jgi:galactose mutarotase-like enzyme
VIVDELASEFRIVGLRNDAIEIRVIPQLGSKICSLVNRRTAREWMWHPPGSRRYFRNKTGDAFAESTLVGADECLPTVAACRWQNRELTDHGEVWSEAWILDEDAFEGEKLVTRLRLPISPLQIERTICLQGSRVRISYKLENVADESLDYIWALHPMMAIEVGDRLILPKECSRLRLDATVVNCGLGERGQFIHYPQPSPGINLESLEFDRDSAAVKFFTEPLSTGRAALRNEHSGDYIIYSINPRELNTFGIWINRGGWSGYHHVAIEPTNGAPDPLDLAVSQWKRFSSLEPGEVRQWEVNIFVGTDPELNSEGFLDRFSPDAASEIGNAR